MLTRVRAALRLEALWGWLGCITYATLLVAQFMHSSGYNEDIFIILSHTVHALTAYFAYVRCLRLSLGRSFDTEFISAFGFAFLLGIALLSLLTTYLTQLFVVFVARFQLRYLFSWCCSDSAAARVGGQTKVSAAHRTAALLLASYLGFACASTVAFIGYPLTLLAALRTLIYFLLATITAIRLSLRDAQIAKKDFLDSVPRVSAVLLPNSSEGGDAASAVIVIKTSAHTGPVYVSTIDGGDAAAFVNNYHAAPGVRVAELGVESARDVPVMRWLYVIGPAMVLHNVFDRLTRWLEDYLELAGPPGSEFNPGFFWVVIFDGLVFWVLALLLQGLCSDTLEAVSHEQLPVTQKHGFSGTCGRALAPLRPAAVLSAFNNFDTPFNGIPLLSIVGRTMFFPFGPLASIPVSQVPRKPFDGPILEWARRAEAAAQEQQRNMK